MSIENVANYISADLDKIQAFMDEHITLDSPMTAASIYEKIKGSLKSNVKENVFKTSLSANVSLGRIKGFRGRKRIGYCKIDPSAIAEPVTTLEDASSDEDESDSDNNKKFVVNITKTLRITHSDKWNFTSQKLSGNTWQNLFYHSSLGDAMKACVKYLIKSGLKESSVTVSLKENIEHLQKIESTILGEIISLPKHPIESSINCEEITDDESVNDTDVETGIEQAV